MEKNAFKSTYDPLIDKTPGHGSDYAPTYWVASAGTPPEHDGAISDNCEVDVAIIGGGFTGLATAMFLAQSHNIKAHVLEANGIGWGCTSRNGGQGHLAWGRLSRSQWVQRWGKKQAQKIHNNTLEGFDVFRQLVNDPEIDCEPCDYGNLLISHCASAHQALIQESKICNEVLGYETQILDKATVLKDYINDQEAFGALLEPVGIGVHPLKLAYGYHRKARKHGAKVHPHSPVSSWQKVGDWHYLLTPNGTVKAQKVVIATAGYTHASLHPLTAYRNMPIMANSAVTRELTEEERIACNFSNHVFITDTRKLRYYYRFLPNNRLQIGTRSAISGKDTENPQHLKNVQQAIATKFPILEGIEIEYFWNGWMDISHDMMPRIVQPDPKESIFYAQGYSGNGVSFSAYASKKLAELVAGHAIDIDLPIFTSPLPTHILRPFRRMGQRLLYGYYSHLDTRP